MYRPVRMGLRSYRPRTDEGSRWNLIARSCSAYWNTIPAAATKIEYAHSAGTTGTTGATASLRFGMRTSTSQPPGTYIAPITLDVLAPNT